MSPTAIDKMMLRDLSVYFLGTYEDDESGSTIRVYENDTQRVLVEVLGESWTVFTHHSSGK